MRSRFISFIKRIYYWLVSTKMFKWLEPKAERMVRNQRRRKMDKLMERAFEGMDSVSAKDVQARIVECQGTGHLDITVDAFGKLEGFSLFDEEEIAFQLESALRDSSVDARLCLTSKAEREASGDALQGFCKALDLLTVVPGECLTLVKGETKLVVVAFEIPRENPQLNGELEIDSRLIKQLAYARNIDANYVIAYAQRDSNPSLTLSPFERMYFRCIANLGCRYIIGINDQGILKGNNIKKYTGRYSHIVDSLGYLFGCARSSASAARQSSAVLRIETSTNEGRLTTSSSYVPFYVEKTDVPYKRMLRIDRYNFEHHDNPAIADALRYLETNLTPLRDIRDRMTVGDICHILEVDMPDEYAYLEDRNVGRICSRSFEVHAGDVFFLLEPFHDPNDQNPVSDEARLRVMRKAVRRGAKFVFSYLPLDPEIPHIVIEQCREGHIAVCAELRRRHSCRSIGITGSIGKTSTKDMLVNVLKQGYVAMGNTRNSNTQVNIGMILQDLPSDIELYVQEIGGGRPGGASRHSRMVLPECTVVTNIGFAHIGNHGTQENLMKAKLGIIDGMPPNGVLFLNADDPLLKKAVVPVKTVTYAVKNHKADYYIDNIEESEGGQTFEIVHGEHRVKARLEVLGEYNALNAACCYAIGQHFGLSDEQIVAGLAEFRTSGMRQNLISVGNVSLFVDCFNASPASYETSLSVLEAMEVPGKKFAILGDVTGAAELTEEMHEIIGDTVVQHPSIDMFICYGEESKIVYRKAVAAGLNAVSYTTESQIREFLASQVHVGDAVLFKGSSKMKLSERIDESFGTCLTDQRFLDKRSYRTVVNDGVTYFVYPDYATVDHVASSRSSAKIRKRVHGAPVYNLGPAACGDMENLSSVRIPEGIRHIGEGCFESCGSLTAIALPASVKYISASAFARCTQLSSVKLNAGLRHIEDRAFAGCTSLEKITVPSSVTEMGSDVFAGCTELTVYCPRGSYAERYCHDNGIEYNVI